MQYKNQNLLLSIHVEYAMSIINGQKSIELRRRFPIFTKEDKKKIFIYACAPISKIIGECDLTEVKRFSLKALWDETKDHSMINYCLFKRYFKDCNFGFALYLKNPVKYNTNKTLKEIFGKNENPPQSYRYVSDKLAA